MKITKSIITLMTILLSLSFQVNASESSLNRCDTQMVSLVKSMDLAYSLYDKGAMKKYDTVAKEVQSKCQATKWLEQAGECEMNDGSNTIVNAYYVQKTCLDIYL